MCCFSRCRCRHIDPLLSRRVIGFSITLWLVKSYTWLKNTQDATLRIAVILGSQFKSLTIKNSSRIFIVVLHLYGTREDTKILAKIVSAHAKKCSRMEVSVAEGRWVGQKRGSVAPLGAWTQNRAIKSVEIEKILCPIPMGITVVSGEKAC